MSFNHPPRLSPDDKHKLPFVSILRPIKGWEPNLELCLNSACLLDYPKDSFEVVFCVADGTDAAIPVIETVMANHPELRTKLCVGEEAIGPNPKIRNLSRAYREAVGDIIWILDSNVWVNPGILHRSVRQLEGTDTRRGFKLVHHLPLCVDVTDTSEASEHSIFRKLWEFGGGRLEENFMSSSHAKFYCAINTTGVAPCVVGKSNIFRRSHLAEVTTDPVNDPQNKRQGINYFADNICEDHLLAEKLWMTPLQEEKDKVRAWDKHGMANDVVFQPTENMPMRDYLARRTRWIAVRKYSVLSATLVEPTTESVVASLMLAFALTTLGFFAGYIGSSWSAFWAVWGCSMLWWAVSDRLLFNFLHQYRSTVVDSNSPGFITRKQARSFGAWVLQWVGRELLALGIWGWAMYPGTITWRGGQYKVRWKDMKVEQITMPVPKVD